MAPSPTTDDQHAALSRRLATARLARLAARILTRPHQSDFNLRLLWYSQCVVIVVFALSTVLVSSRVVAIAIIALVVLGVVLELTLNPALLHLLSSPLALRTPRVRALVGAVSIRACIGSDQYTPLMWELQDRLSKRVQHPDGNVAAASEWLHLLSKKAFSDLHVRSGAYPEQLALLGLETREPFLDSVATMAGRVLFSSQLPGALSLLKHFPGAHTAGVVASLELATEVVEALHVSPDPVMHVALAVELAPSWSGSLADLLEATSAVLAPT